MSQSSQGFTLVEMMVVVAIIGIIAAVAFPSYQEQVRKSARAAAKADLLENAQFLERYFTANNRYSLADGSATPLAVTQSPRDGAAKYDLSVTHPDLTSYNLSAIPTGSMVDDRCGTLTLNQLGQKGISGAAAGMTVSLCWN